MPNSLMEVEVGWLCSNSSLPTATMTNERSLPDFPQIPLSSLPQPLLSPVPAIKSEEDVHIWHKTRGYRNYGLFIRRLNEAVVGHELGEAGEDHSQVCTSTPCSWFFPASALIGFMKRQSIRLSLSWVCWNRGWTRFHHCLLLSDLVT